MQIPAIRHHARGIVEFPQNQPAFEITVATLLRDFIRAAQGQADAGDGPGAIPACGNAVGIKLGVRRVDRAGRDVKAIERRIDEGLVLTPLAVEKDLGSGTVFVLDIGDGLVEGRQRDVARDWLAVGVGELDAHLALLARLVGFLVGFDGKVEQVLARRNEEFAAFHMHAAIAD